MRRYITLLLALLLALSLAGCGGYTEEDIAAAKRSAYNEGYEYGYSIGYDNGYKDAPSTSTKTNESSEWVSFEEYYSLLKEANAAGYGTVSEYNAATSNKTSSSGFNQQAYNEYVQHMANAAASGVDTATATQDYVAGKSYDSIFTYGTDADSIMDYIHDNPHEFNLYTEGDMCDAHEAGANGEDWFVR